jgi:hypothetical protein
MDTASLESYVSRAWSVFKVNYFAFIAALLVWMAILGALFLIGMLPLMIVIIRMVASSAGFTASLYGNAVAFLLSAAFAAVFLVLAVIASFALQGGLTAMAVEALAKGNTSFRTMLSSARAKWKSFAGVSLLVTLINMALMVVLLAPGLLLLGAAPTAGWLLFFLGVLVVLLAALYLSVLFAFVYLAVLDGRKAVAALRASMDFGKKNFWDTLVLMIVLAAVSFLAALLNAVVPILGTLIAYFVVVPLQMLSIAALYAGRKKGAAVKPKRKK